MTNWRAALNFILINLAENQSYCLYNLSWHEIVNRPLATSCEILVVSAKIFSRIGDQESAISGPCLEASANLILGSYRIL